MNQKLRPIAIFAVAFLLFTGCKTVVRENIISSINTGIGISVAENPKTEMYEVKIGYIRSQFYSVPTGKNVEGDTNHFSNAADRTPELISGIRMHSGIEQLLVGVDVSESFAVGAKAVMSPAAVAMYIADADNSTKALAAAGASAAVAKSLAGTPVAGSLGTVEKKLKIANIRASGGANVANVDAAIRKPANGGFADWNAFLEGNPTDAQLDAILQELNSH